MTKQYITYSPNITNAIHPSGTNIRPKRKHNIIPILIRGKYNIT